jgi:hypothetical protein
MKEPHCLQVHHVPPDAKQTAERILFRDFFGAERNTSLRDWRQQGDRWCGGGEVCVIFHCEFSKSR